MSYLAKIVGAGCVGAVAMYLALWVVVGAILGCTEIAAWLTPDRSLGFHVAFGVFAGGLVLLLVEKVALRRFSALEGVLNVY